MTTEDNTTYLKADEDDFNESFKRLTIGVAYLITSGIDPNSLTVEFAISDFLEQYDPRADEDFEEAPEPEKTDHTRAKDTPFGFVIRDKWDGREVPDFKDSFYLSEKAAIASIDQAYARPDYNEFEIVPLYL